MKFLKRKTPKNTTFSTLSTGLTKKSIFDIHGFNSAAHNSLYGAVRASVPIIDAALTKIVRLTGGFKVICTDKSMQDELDYFVDNVPVGLCGKSLATFIDNYLNSLLTFGNATGEIIYDKNGLGIAGLFNASCENLEVCGKSPTDPFERKYFITSGKNREEVKYPERILFTAINVPPGKIYGTSILQGLPCFADILMRIYTCIGQNYDRIGNVRYAVTYNPPATPEGRVYASDNIKKIAEEWSDGMHAAARGEIKDFVSTGDVKISVIGADNPLLDTEIPVKQCLEQIIAKLGIPPFMLGLSWSTTERMSQQQSDILTSELEFYRRQLTPVIVKICTDYLRLSGNIAECSVEWDNISLQDEVELANARLTNAQAEKLEESQN